MGRARSRQMSHPLDAGEVSIKDADNADLADPVQWTPQ